MTQRLTRNDVERIATLARLELSDAEKDLFVRQLTEVLEYAEQIQSIDTTGVPPTASVVTRHEADRVDEVRPSLDRDETLANAPDANHDAGLFKVPRVIA